MDSTMVVLGCLLLGQAASLDEQASSPEQGQAQATALPEMMAAALIVPQGSAVSGQPLGLLTVLSATPDRRQQLELTHAYWRLAETLAAYRFHFDHDRQLQRLQAQGAEAESFRPARASAAALLREAEVAAVAAQHDLAVLMRLPGDAPLPLPADPPHVGPYHTSFSELFSSRPAPAQARLIDRTMPMRLRAIEGRFAAVGAADEALAASQETRRLGRAALNDVLACSQECLQQRQALIGSVGRYNSDIAEYALAVAAPATSPQVLLGMMIKSTHDSGTAVVPEVPSGVRPVAAHEPIPAPVRRIDGNRPTPAAPREQPGAPRQGVPTPAKRRPPAQPDDRPDPGAADEPAPASKNEPTSAPPRELPDATDAPLPMRPLVPLDPQPREPARTRVNKAPTPAPRTSGQSPSPSSGQSASRSASPSSALAPASSDVALATPALYAALIHAEPAVRTRQLTLALHWDRALPSGIGEPISLADCLRNRSGNDRRAVIEAFWLARQRAAAYQVFAEQAQWLDDLGAATSGDGARTAPLRLRPAKLATGAAVQEAHVALVEAQFELAVRLGRVTDRVWPLPSTVPHSGPCPVKLDVPAGSSVGSWLTRRLAAVTAGLSSSLERRATAVVEADAARAAAVAAYQADGRSPEVVLAAISRQTAQTMAFLHTLTAYNRAIADSALATLPPETPSDNLAAMLVPKS